ncbi:transporter [Singulisphaera sp. PoT]|uniref:transporter n=1 Tax=Singulisphaera sp. PoT TaxID=3411797 RepID=UPI003BF5D99C
MEPEIPDVGVGRARSLTDVAGESLFGALQPEAWRPLGIGSLLTEGWDQPYAPAAGDAPRQTWVGSADGAFYRLYVASFSFASLTGGGDAYNGTAILFSPLSRRLELGWFVPFVASAPDASRPSGAGNLTNFGDLTIAPRVLLAEDRRYSLTSNLFVRLPTGDARNGNGAASLSPDVEFWANPFDRWVIRGGLGVTIPTNDSPASSALQRVNPWTGFNATPSNFTSFDARLAVGQYLTSAEAHIFKSFVYYAAANLHTELSGGNATYLSITPGFRFGIGGDWYVLGGLEVPLVGAMPFETQTTFQFIRNF